MAFELPRRALEHARTLTQDEATHFIVDALIHMLAETEEAIEALRLEVDTLKKRLPDPE
jgi:hypothetical protein